MAYTQSVKVTTTTPGGTRSHEKTNQADGSDMREITVPGLAADMQITMGIDVSEVQSVVIAADQDLTLEWNDNVGTQGSLAIKANVPIFWHADCHYTNPLDVTDVTDFYVSNPGEESATLLISVIQDSTP